MRLLNSSKVRILERVPYRWQFDVYLNSNLFQRVVDTRFIQVETKEEALEIARRYKWLYEIQQSSHPRKLTYTLTPQFK